MKRKDYSMLEVLLIAYCMALAEWLERIGEAELARENLRHASHGTNDNFEILLALGGLSYRLGDLADAATAFEQAYEKRPTDEDAAFNLGAVRLAEQRFVEAITILRPLVERPYAIKHSLKEFGETPTARYTRTSATALTCPAKKRIK